jgi:hypothetical protein
MILTLNNLVQSLIGKRAKADHPMTVINPEEYFIIIEAKIEDNKILVRGDKTAWFSGEMIEIDLDNKSRLNKVQNLDRDNEVYTVKVNGAPFYCECGCNVFNKPDNNRPKLYECNACGLWYEGY